MKYKIGQILTSKNDMILEKFSGEKVTVPKGNKVVVGADKLAHHISTGDIQSFPEGTEFDGYDAKGIAYYIVRSLAGYFPMSEFWDEFDISQKEFTDEIEYALCDIGML